ncbi:glutamate racemase [Prosthecochloris vibrioformis]|uniref:Glutamate racemase n=1 Tax=Prosthecochloris vibrioformis TaxID=1098 RepID=A0A5C4S3D6_PROVB|nr:glutamate racemase [Prosthecochloris vibrioformis]TNJ37993.1 glutamate racemase [Prosthecochloris vibrioformis]
MLSREQPIGIFDSGIGGLTVAKAVRNLLPHERIIYFGDTARVPYGSKSQVAIRKYAQDDARLLMRYQPKLIIAACNTVSALALDVVRTTGSGIPVLGVLDAGAGLASRKTRNGRVGVIGTRATISSNAYSLAIERINAEITVFSRACPLFVPLAEEGFASHASARLIAEEYLAPLQKEGIDTLVLGCTHYPLLKQLIGEIMGDEVIIIDSADAVALQTEALLQEMDLEAPAGDATAPHIIVSDLPQKFQALYTLFMGDGIPDVEVAEI